MTGFFAPLLLLLRTQAPTLQETAEQVLTESRVPYGAIVVVHVPDARVLALAARSQAEPELGPDELALAPWAPAASIFKLVTAAALLDGRNLSPELRTCFHGGMHAIEPIHLVDSRADRECETLGYAIAHSQNAIIAKLAHRLLTPALLSRYAQAFGFGEELHVRQTPVGASIARIPADPLAFARTAAGFWNVRLSPLHAALLANAIAAGGWFHVPDDSEPPRRVMSLEAAHELSRMMVRTTREGTARSAFHPALPFEVAGKTGTLTREQPYLAYSWFVGFAPADRPQIAFAVLVGNGEDWRWKAAPLARRFLDAWGRSFLLATR